MMTETIRNLCGFALTARARGAVQDSAKLREWGRHEAGRGRMAKRKRLEGAAQRWAGDTDAAAAGEPGAAGELDAVRARRAGAGWADAGGRQPPGGPAPDRSRRCGVRGRADGRGRAARTAPDAGVGGAGRPATERRW